MDFTFRPSRQIFMKDDYRRRRKAEQHLVRTLPDVDPNLVFKPIHQESLNTVGGGVRDVRVQDNEFVVICTEKWCLEVYVLDKASCTTEMITDSISEISDVEMMPTHFRTPLWCAIPRGEGSYNETLSNCIFVAPDIIGCSRSASGDVSTWYVRSGEQLEVVTLRGVRFEKAICKISDTEFVIGSMEGHMHVFTHKHGYNLQESKRIWKAHASAILSFELYKGIIVSASFDRSARLWDAKTKERLAILQHCATVVGITVSDEYIVTCSFSESGLGELRLYQNESEYTLMKILVVQNWVYKPRILSNGSVLFRLFTPMKNDLIEQEYLCVVDFEREKVLTQLKVACRKINDYEVLPDGRVIVVGLAGCYGVIAKFPRRTRNLITPKSGELEGNRRRLCLLT